MEFDGTLIYFHVVTN